MAKQSMFTPNGDGYDISVAGVFILCAETVYGNPSESTPAGVRNARSVMEGVLSAARAGGFTQCDVLETLLSRKQFSRRVMEMTQAACDAAGPDAMADVFQRAGLGLNGGGASA